MMPVRKAIRLGVMALVAVTLVGCTTAKKDGTLLGVPPSFETPLNGNASTDAMSYFLVGDDGCTTYKPLSPTEMACFNKDGTFTENRHPLSANEVEAYKKGEKKFSAGAVILAIAFFPVWVVFKLIKVFGLVFYIALDILI